MDTHAPGRGLARRLAAVALGYARVIGGVRRADPWQRYRRVIRRYVPSPYPGRVALFCAQERPTQRSDLGWSSLLPRLEITAIPAITTRASRATLRRSARAWTLSCGVRKPTREKPVCREFDGRLVGASLHRARGLRHLSFAAGLGFIHRPVCAVQKRFAGRSRIRVSRNSDAG